MLSLLILLMVLMLILLGILVVRAVLKENISMMILGEPGIYLCRNVLRSSSELRNLTLIAISFVILIILLYLNVL